MSADAVGLAPDAISLHRSTDIPKWREDALLGEGSARRWSGKEGIRRGVAS
jgi:hypothetical protein